MESIKGERKLLKYTYLLCILLFVNLSILQYPFNKKALVMGIVMCILIGYSHFVIRKFFPDGDKYIFVFASILSVIGVSMIYRLNNMEGLKQLIWFAFAVTGFILIVILFPELKRFERYKYVYLGLTIFFMALATFFGKEINGSKNWIVIGPLMLQPSEFGKLFLVAYLASTLKQYKNFKSLIEPTLVVMGSLGFMVFQKDLGSALIIFGISITMLYIATSKFKYVLTCFILFAIGAYFSYRLFGHVRLRFKIWQNPWNFADNEGFQLVQSQIAVAWGGLSGTGIGLGYPNKYVPVNTSDFIFTSICEELGIVTGFGIIILYFLLFYRCMRAAIYAEDNFSRLLTVGYSAMIATQALVIIGGNINMIPLTGITLPLVSYGGSSMLITFFSLGIIQKISET